jgi:thymidylate kinase
VFLIIEGIHDTGKTTLINKICANSNYLLFQSKRLFPELAIVNNTSISDFATGNNCAISWFAQNFSEKLDIIFDRLHFSEYAYSRLFRNVDDTIAMSRFRMVNDKLTQFKVKLIYLHCDYDILATRAKERNTAVYNEDHHKKLTEYFTTLVKETKMSCCCINTGENNEDLTYIKAMDFLKE